MPRSLNEEQSIAVQHLTGPLLVLAGAGSGKTRIVTFRIAHLIDQGVPPESILALTFTNKAAGEMKERVHKLCSASVIICTFHSLGVRILRECIDTAGFNKNFIIYDEDDSNKVLKGCLDTLNLKDKEFSVKVFKALISNAKNQLISPDDVPHGSSPVENFFPQVYSAYQAKLKEYNALDFDDLLYLTVKLFQSRKDVLEYYQNRWQFLLIDEYQDTNEAQYMLARLLVEKTHNIFVVGDPDQSIYSWRGANINNILNFQTDYPGAKVVRLEQNYRSQSTILDAANALIQHNEGRLEKNLWSALGKGEKLSLHVSDDERGEASFVVNEILEHKNNRGCSLNEIVVFYRTNFQSRVFEDALLRKRIPYIIVGGISFYHRKEIKDILAFLRLIYSPSDFVSFERTINIPKRGFGASAIDKLRLCAEQLNISILEVCQRIIADDEHVRVKLNSKQKENLKTYLNLFYELKNYEGSLQELVKQIIRQSGYLDYLKEDKETYEDRKENIEELIAKAREWELLSENPTLASFLEELSLKASLDEANLDGEKIHLMTIHNGKGLEFDVAFMVGMEEDLFPHANARDSVSALEEERRLCYVGMTRAKNYLYLTTVQSRYLWGSSRYMRPSRFLFEIPKEHIQKVQLTWPKY